MGNFYDDEEDQGYVPVGNEAEMRNRFGTSFPATFQDVEGGKEMARQIGREDEPTDEEKQAKIREYLTAKYGDTLGGDMAAVREAQEKATWKKQVAGITGGLQQMFGGPNADLRQSNNMRDDADKEVGDAVTNLKMDQAATEYLTTQKLKDEQQKMREEENQPGSESAQNFAKFLQGPMGLDDDQVKQLGSMSLAQQKAQLPTFVKAYEAKLSKEAQIESAKEIAELKARSAEDIAELNARTDKEIEALRAKERKEAKATSNTNASSSDKAHRTATGKPPRMLPTPEVNLLTDGRAAIREVGGLDELLEQNKKIMGPMRGKVGGLNPYDKEAQKFQASIDQVKQQVGKFMEGGVLRKEDEIKYAKILPQLDNTPEVAKAKVENVRKMLRDRYKDKVQLLESQGYSVAGLEDIEAQPEAAPAPKPAPNAETKTIGADTYVKVPGGWKKVGGK